MCWEVMLERDWNVMTGAGETVIRRRVKVLESDSNSNPSSAMYNTCAKQAVLSEFSSVKWDPFLLHRML